MEHFCFKFIPYSELLRGYMKQKTFNKFQHNTAVCLKAFFRRILCYHQIINKAQNIEFMTFCRYIIDINQLLMACNIFL